jgi:hypothetical protein
VSAAGGGLTLLVVSALQVPAVGPDTVRLSRATIADAMREEHGYDRRATTNQSRFQTRVLLRLARSARVDSATVPVLFIDYDDWFHAYLEALDLRADEVPFTVRLTHQYQFDILVDRRLDAVVARVNTGRAPLQALNVLWRSRLGTAYGYRDSLARPQLEVRFEPTVSYRLLEFEGMVLLDDIAGVQGRPATGPLSLLFRLIGQARAVWSRSAIAADGWQVVRARGRKGPFTRTATVTVQPDGTADPGVPDERPDLADLERRLRESLEIEYHRWTRD